MVRLTADCPLASPAVADRVIAEFHDSGADYVSNTLQPTYPDGLDVEVVRADVLRWVAEHSDGSARAGARDPRGVSPARPVRRSRTCGATRTCRICAGPSTTPTTSRSCERSTHACTRRTRRSSCRTCWISCDRSRRSSRTSMDAERNAALKGLDTGAMDG